MDRWGELYSTVSGECPMAGFCEHCNEPSGSIKKGYFLTDRVTISFSNNVLHYGVSNIRETKSRSMRQMGSNILVEEREKKYPLCRPKSRDEDNIKMDVKEIGWVRIRSKWRAI
jgi:hypothetical protein